MLKNLGIVKTRNKGYHIFVDHIAPDFINNTMRPSEYVNHCWNRYETSNVHDKDNNSLNGTIFELIIATLFVKEGIMPLHLQAKVAFVPNINFDIVLYTNETGPIGISLKTSLRERYKQADLEAIALKYVHRKAQNYLITLDRTEAKSVSQKISEGAVLGINKVIIASAPEFDAFIEELKEKTFIAPGSVEIISAARVVTQEAVDALRRKQ